MLIIVSRLRRHRVFLACSNDTCDLAWILSDDNYERLIQGICERLCPLAGNDTRE